MNSPRARRVVRVAVLPALLVGLAGAVSACTAGPPAMASGPTAALPGRAPSTAAARAAHARSARTATVGKRHRPRARPANVPRLSLAAPAALAPFGPRAYAGEGTWHPAGRHVDGMPVIYETTLVPPGGTQHAGIAWMDTKLLSARLYSGSLSPGGGPYKYTAPIEPAQAASLVAAFNGGFKMADADGGYYTEGHLIDPLVTGAASLVIYANGSVTVGAWGSDVRMTPNVVAVRQNLVPLVADGRPAPLAASSDWQAWGNTCGATSCASSVPGIEHQWRSGVGVTANGALVYVAGPALDPLQVARLLVRAGVVRGMQLDINPDWPVFASYDPATPHGLAAPSNGSKLLSTTTQGPWTFFEPTWARDFITMSARPPTRARPKTASHRN